MAKNWQKITKNYGGVGSVLIELGKEEKGHRGIWEIIGKVKGKLPLFYFTGSVGYKWGSNPMKP